MAKGKKISLHNHFLVWKERSKSNTIERGSLVPFLPKINIKIQGPSSRLQRTFSFKKKRGEWSRNPSYSPRFTIW
jgi:hypothetical protein